MENELALCDIELGALTMTDFPIQIDEEIVLNLVHKNNPQYQALEIERLNAEYSLHIAKTNKHKGILHPCLTGSIQHQFFTEQL